MSCQGLWAPQSWNDNSRAHMVSWRSLVLCHLWPQTIHCWLPWASLPCRNCPELVSEVCFNPLLLLDSPLIEYDRCDAKPDNLDAQGSHQRSHKKTRLLIECFDPGILWKEFGIHGDVKVRRLSVSLKCYSDFEYISALHSILSMGQHSWAFITQFTTPGN